jgi:hypothetical protein
MTAQPSSRQPPAPNPRAVRRCGRRTAPWPSTTASRRRKSAPSPPAAPPSPNPHRRLCRARRRGLSCRPRDPPSAAKFELLTTSPPACLALPCVSNGVASCRGHTFLLVSLSLTICTGQYLIRPTRSLLR